MAIQLNERDHLIFKLIDEHQVLLEKHISWFIASDDKPVLIRDRLRKLFYLDYLLCERHRDTLPWWTTPTKPLVYTLSPMTRELMGVGEDDATLAESDKQRHLLEIANLRMLYLLAQNEGLISKCEWTTIASKGDSELIAGIDAKINFQLNGTAWRVAIMNQPQCNQETITQALKQAFAKLGVELVLMVSRDSEHQKALQKAVASLDGSASLIKRAAFATHQELYKSGITKTRWQNAEQRQLNLWPAASETSQPTWIGAVPQTMPA